MMINQLLTKNCIINFFIVILIIFLWRRLNEILKVFKKKKVNKTSV